MSKSSKECWSPDDLKEHFVGGVFAGTVVGSLGDGIGAIPGAIVGAVVGVADWGLSSAFELNCQMKNSAVESLPPVSLDGADKK